jgi:GT2 family glycosyltransferase
MNNMTSHPRSEFHGAITGLYGDVLQGWALDNAQPDVRLVVEVLVDGASVALVRADQFQPNAIMGDQFHGFSVHLKDNWLTNASQISARIANQAQWLEGSLQLPGSQANQPAAIASQVWYNGGLQLSGWSWDPDAPNRHMQITVREGSQVHLRAICDLRHVALFNRSSADHGFNLDLPWALADGKPHILHIENDLGQALSGSPVTVCCWPEGLEGLMRDYAQSPGDQNTLNLLTQLASEQNRWAPKSAGFHHYPQWFECFQQPCPMPMALAPGNAGVLLISEGNQDDDAISLASIHDQRMKASEVAVGHSDNVLPALLELLAAGCNTIIHVTGGDRLALHATDQLHTLLSDGNAWAYADCDRDGPQRERSLPWLKPVWDVDLFIGADLFSPGAAFSAGIVKEALELLTPEQGLTALDWHHLLAAIALASERSKAPVVHLPHVLYHRNHKSPASPADAPASPDRREAMEWLSQGLARGARVEALPGYPGLLRTRWPLPRTLPRVSLVVPTRDQVGLLRTCIEGLLGNTDYPNLEIIVVDNQSSDPQALEYLAGLPARGVTVLAHPYPFNYSTINNRAVEQASGELIGLVNNDIEILEPNWLKEMVSQVIRPGVGAVGAKLLWPNGMVQHGGVVVGINGLAAHTGNTLNKLDPGYLGLNQLARQQSAVTAACLLVRKSLYQRLGGLDERAFPVAFNDVDLCLKIQKNGLKLIWTPFAQLIHAESASRGKDHTAEKKSRAMREQQMFIERWSQSGQQDAYYHPALSADYLSGPYGGLATPPRSTAPRTLRPLVSDICTDHRLPTEAAHSQTGPQATPATPTITVDDDRVIDLTRHFQPVSIGIQQ